ncbi:unnamed protein product, partial [Rotaria sp. Silwood2]
LCPTFDFITYCVIRLSSAHVNCVERLNSAHVSM